MKPASDIIKKMGSDAIRIFHDAAQAVEPRAAVKRVCNAAENRILIGRKSYDLSRFKNIFVIGAGKASAPMAEALEDLHGNKIATRIVVGNDGYTVMDLQIVLAI